MAKIKILLSSRPKLLSDVIRNLIKSQPDMELLGEVSDPMQLLITGKDTVADAIVITPLKTNGVPKICKQLLLEHPDLLILSLQANTDSATLYRSNYPPLRFLTPTNLVILNVLRGGPIPDAI